VCPFVLLTPIGDPICLLLLVSPLVASCSVLVVVLLLMPLLFVGLRGWPHSPITIVVGGVVVVEASDCW